MKRFGRSWTKGASAAAFVCALVAGTAQTGAATPLGISGANSSDIESLAMGGLGNLPQTVGDMTETGTIATVLAGGDVETTLVPETDVVPRTVAPEPTPLVMLGTGCGMLVLGFAIRRKTRAAR